MSRLITRIENASARVASRITKELVNGTMIASTATAATTSETLSRLVICSLPPEQAGWLDGEDQRHRGVERKVGHLRKQRLAEIVREADEKRADRGAAEAAHAADDHH